MVEEAPGGGRRRILRPWGLSSSAPPTVSPDFPDLAVSPILAERRAWRVDVGLAGAVAAIVVLIAALHPWLRRAGAEPVVHVDERAVSAPASVATPVSAIAQEARLAAPALVEREPPAAPAGAPRAAQPAATAVQPPLRAASGQLTTPVNYAAMPRETIIGDGQSADMPAATALPPSAAPPSEQDRWQALRAELERCQPRGVFERATCEQQARLAHCDSYWGHASLCPPLLAGSGR